MANYYNDEAAPSEAGASGPDDQARGANEQDDQAEGESALLPKSIFGGKDPQPGDTCSFKVVHVYEDEVEVEYAKEDEDDSEMGKADTKLSVMGQDAEAPPAE